MVSVTDSDLTVKLVFWLAMAVLFLDMVLLSVLLGMRLLLIMQEKRRQQFLSIWRPLLMQSLVEPQILLPRVQRRDRLTLLNLWNYIHASLQGELKENLNAIGDLLGITQMAKKMLKSSSTRHKLLGILTLGNLRERSVWRELQHLATTINPFVSITAARALVQIDATQAIVFLSPLIRDRTDWSLTRIVNLLQEAPREVIIPPLTEAILQASPKKALRLLRCLENTHSSELVSLVQQLLEKFPDNEEVIAACLRTIAHFQTFSNLELARQYVTHPSWVVRVQAANALAQMGVEEDELRLIALLSDEEWWVRYRAAQALASLPFLDVTRLEEIREQISDRYAQDMLTQVIEEKRASSL